MRSRTEILQKSQIFESLIDVASNGEKVCRLNAFKCLWEISQYPGLSKDRKSAVVALCIKSCSDDPEAKSKTAALELLKALITKQGVAEMGEKCVPVATSLLEHKDANVCTSACETLQYVCVSTSGKHTCIKSGSVPKLVKNLNHGCKRVRMHSSAALMEIAVTVEGKKEIVEAKGVQSLLSKLDDEDAIKNYTLQALTNMFSHESVRHQSKAVDENVQKISKLTKSPDPIVAESAKACLDKLQWEP